MAKVCGFAADSGQAKMSIVRSTSAARAVAKRVMRRIRERIVVVVGEILEDGGWLFLWRA